jgi:hypothetical protein
MSSDTFDFLARVLPVDGYPVITHSSIGQDGKKFWIANAFDDIRSAAGWAQWLTAKDVDVYFACATYTEVEPIEGKRRYKVERKQSNVHSVQALWADLDIKPEGNHHRTGKDALLALQSACKALGLPFPQVVKSGRGLHLYWLLSQAVAPAVWKPVALALERALLKHNVLIDQGVTPDAARILRPVGSLWRKETPHRPVTLYRGMDDDLRRSAAWYLARLGNYVEASDATRFFSESDDEFMGGMYPAEEINADAVADKCAQLGAFRDTQGDVEEPLWYASLGLLKFCADGEEIAQAWSEGHPDYDPDVTAAKMAQWKAGPTTCARFKELNPTGCAGCPHADKVKTPLRLGRTGSVSEPNKKHASDLIPGYEWCESTQHMIAIRRDEDGQPARIPFSNTRYWVHNYILENGTAQLVLHSEHQRFGRKDLVEEHSLDLSAIGGGGRDLHGKLAGIMLTDTSGNRQLARSYLLDYQEYLKRNVREIQTYRQMGWVNDNEFLMGDRVITPDKEFEVRLGGQAATKTGVYETDKPVEDWKHVVETIYNREHGEPYQFAICASLGSALVPLLGLEEFSGIPIALTSDESGYGKTTACWVAMAAWGAVRRGLNVLSGDEASLISMEWQLSIYNHMPTLFDEQTNRDGSFTSHMLYMMSNGTARARGTSDGKLREMAPPWRGIHFLTGNRNILHKLTESKANPEAAQMRVFEISLDGYPKLATLRQAQELSHDLNKVRSGFGQIGVDFIRYVMANRARVKQLMDDMPKKYFKGMHHDKERFYVNAAVCALTAGVILRKLGYIQFDMKALAEWTKNHILTLRGNVDELRQSTEDNLGRCLTALCQRLLVTDYMDKADQDPIIPVRGDVAGRVAVIDRRCYITLQAVTEWCMKSGVQWTRFRASLINEGLMSREMIDLDTGKTQPSIRTNLGKGVKGYTTGMARVIALDYNRIARTLSDLDLNNHDNVTPIRGDHHATVETADLRGSGGNSEHAG